MAEIVYSGNWQNEEESALHPPDYTVLSYIWLLCKLQCVPQARIARAYRMVCSTAHDARKPDNGMPSRKRDCSAHAPHTERL